MLRLHPADGRVSWSFDFSYLPTGSSAAAFGDETGLGWLSPSFPSDAGGLGANLDRTQARPAFVDLGPEPDGPLGCPQTAALLDADAPTALFHAVVEGDDGLSGSSLIVAHRGERVWRADGVREGLSRTQVLFDSVVVLPE